MADETQSEPTKPETSNSSSIGVPIADDDVTPAVVTITTGGGGLVPKFAAAGRKDNIVYVNVAEDDKNFYYARKGNKNWINEIHDAMDENKKLAVNLDRSKVEQIEAGGAKYYLTSKVKKKP